MVIEADVDEDPDFLGHLVQDYQATVIEIKDLSPTIKGIRLQLDRPIEFQAGQYINVSSQILKELERFQLPIHQVKSASLSCIFVKLKVVQRRLMYMNNLPRVISLIFRALMVNFCTQVR